MAKKTSNKNNGEATGPKRGEKSSAVRAYLSKNRKAMPKQVVAALKDQGIDVSPNLVSIIKAQVGIKKARRKATQAVANHDVTAVAQSKRVGGLDAALILYK